MERLGTIPLDGGEVQRRPGLSIASVAQEPVLPPAETLRESLVLRGEFAAMHDERALWAREARLNEYLQRFAVNPDASPASVSGGERKRAALALAFAMAPDLMLLDEPTNHLDVGGIETLEELLQRNITCIVITHDRRFLDQVANAIAELDRGQLRTFPGNYTVYEERKAEINLAEDLARRRFEKFWAQEEVWIRKGVEARRTRNEGRVKRLEHLREERAARRERVGQIKLTVDTGERSGKLVAEFENVTKGFGERRIIDDVSLRVMRGDRVGLLGPNGAGKTTMIKLIVGTLEPDSGRVRRGTHLQVAYFDQLRDQLDPECTLAETVSPGPTGFRWARTANTFELSAGFLFDSRRSNAPIACCRRRTQPAAAGAPVRTAGQHAGWMNPPTPRHRFAGVLETMLVTTRTCCWSAMTAPFWIMVTQTIAAEGDAGGANTWVATAMAAAEAAGTRVGRTHAARGERVCGGARAEAQTEFQGTA